MPFVVISLWFPVSEYPEFIVKDPPVISWTFKIKVTLSTKLLWVLKKSRLDGVEEERLNGLQVRFSVDWLCRILKNPLAKLLSNELPVWDKSSPTLVVVRVLLRCSPAYNFMKFDLYEWSPIRSK